MQSPSKHLHYKLLNLPIAAAESWEFFCRLVWLKRLQMLILSTDQKGGQPNQFSSKSIDPKHINPDAQIISHDQRADFINARCSSADVFYSPPNKPTHLLDLCMSWRCRCAAELPCSFERLGFSPCRVPPSHYRIMWRRDALVTAASPFLTRWQHDNLLIKVSGTPSTPAGTPMISTTCRRANTATR